MSGQSCGRSLLLSASTRVYLQAGEYILTEGEELTSTSKFYLVQSGTVECFKQFNVSTTRSQQVATVVVLCVHVAWATVATSMW